MTKIKQIPEVDQDTRKKLKEITCFALDMELFIWEKSGSKVRGIS